MPQPPRGAAHTSNDSRTIRSLATLKSWVSAPARIRTSNCFVSPTVFRRRDGQRVRAAELRRDGGEELQGPGGRWATVRFVRRYPPDEQRLISLSWDGGSFLVTWDHRLIVRGSHGEPLVRQAYFLLNCPDVNRAIFDGQAYHEVHAEPDTRCIQVIEICFVEDDESVLAWLLPRRRENRPRELTREAAVACLGHRYSLDDFRSRPGWICRHTFIERSDDPELQPASALRRCRSVGDPPDRRSTWSVGTQLHDEGFEQCHMCLLHHAFLHGQRSDPCPHGRFCRNCHALHPDS